MLQAVASIFDPLGYFSPTILEAKLFMRELWAGKCNWDDKLDDNQLKEWLRVSGNLENIPQHQITRYIGIFDERACCSSVSAMHQPRHMPQLST